MKKTAFFIFIISIFFIFGLAVQNSSAVECTSTAISLLGTSCHDMGNAFFNGAMDQYVNYGGSTLYYCSSNYISGCSSSGSGGGGGDGSSTSCPSSITSLLGSGCHDMGSAYFNGAMDQYVNYGGSTVYYCSTNYLSGCSTGSGGGGGSVPSSPYLTMPSTSASPVYFSWASVSNATYYEVWRRTPSGGGTFTLIAPSITALSYNDTGPISGNSYEYYIKACNSYGCSSSNYATVSISSGGGSTSCPSGIASLLGSGCHDMTNAYFNGDMTQYVNYGGSAVYYCSTNYISGCSTGSGGGGSVAPGSPYLTVPGSSASPVNLSWTTVSGATYYEVWRRTPPSTGTFASVATGLTNASYNDSGVSSDTSYEYYIKACNSYGCSVSNYSTVSVSGGSSSSSCPGTASSLLGSGCHDMTNAYFNGDMTQYVNYGGSTLYYCSTNYLSGCTTGSSGGTIPATPGSLRQYSSTANSITLAWYDNSYSEDKFNLERTLNNTSSWALVSQLGANIINYTDSTVTGGTSYDYRIQACLSGSGCSGYTYLYGVTALSGTAATSTYTSCPSGIASLLGSGCHDMTNAYFNGDMTQYVNYGGSTLYYCSTNYITGCSTSGNTLFPAAPTGLTAAANGSNVNLNWTDNSTNETEFKVYKRLFGSSAWNWTGSSAGANIVSWTISGEISSTYEYYVIACNSSGCSVPSNVVSLSFGGSTSTSCPSNIVSLLGSGCHNMGNSYFNGEMTQYVNYGGSVVYNCNVNYISGCSSGSTTNTSCPSNIASLLGSGCHVMNNNAYFNGEMTQYVNFGGTAVYSCNTNYISGCSNWSTTATTTPSTSCPSNIASLLGSGCHIMNNNAYFNGEMTQYVYFNGSTVYYCSTNYISGCSSGSTTASDVTLPGVISNLTASSPTQNSIVLSWLATGDDGTTGTASSYSIKYSTAPITTEGAWQVAYYTSGIPAPYPAGTSQTMVVSGLSANTTYYFAIKAYDDAGNVSPLSNSPSAKTLLSTATSTVVDTIPPYITNFGYTTEYDGRLRAGVLFSESIDESTLTDSNVYIILFRDGSGVSGTVTKHTVEKGVDYFTSSPAIIGEDYELVIKKNVKDRAGNQMIQDYFSPKFRRSAEATVIPPPTEISPTETPKLVSWGLSVGLDANSTIGVGFNVEMDYATFNESNAYIYKSGDPSSRIPATFQKRPYYAMFTAKLVPGTEYISVIKSTVKSISGLNPVSDYVCKFVALSSGYITSCPQGSGSTDLQIISPEITVKYGSLEAKILDSEEKPVAQAGVHIFKEDFSSNFGGASDSQGLFKNSLPPGTYMLEISPPSGRTDLVKPEPVKFEMLGGEAKKLTIRFGILSKIITGTVLFSNDAPVVDAEVGAYSSINNHWVSVFTDAGGRYTLKMGSGKWIVGIRPKDPAIAKWTWSGPLQEVVFAVNPGQELAYINFRLPVSNSKLIIKAVDDLGNPIENAGIIADTISSSQSYSEAKAAPEFRKTDNNGKAELSLVPALYYVRGVIDIARGFINPDEQPIQLTKDEIREIRMVFKRRSIVETAELSGMVRLENSSPIDAYIWSWSEEGKFAENRADENGKFKVQLAKGEKWHIGAGRVLNNVSYKANDILIDTQNSVPALEIVLLKERELAPPVTVTQTATQQIVVQAQDGAKTFVPSGAISGGASVNVELKPTTEAPSQAGAEVVGSAYDINITDSLGKAITKLTKDMEISLPYTDEELKAKGINEDRLIPSFYDASTTAWLKVDDYTIDKEKDVVIVRVNHLTRFAIVAAADVTPPDAPDSVKISELSGGKIKIAWINPSKDFHHVKIYRSETTGEFGTIALNDLTGTSAEDTGLAGGKTYYYLLRSIDPAGNESNNTTQTKIVMAGTLAKMEVKKEEPGKIPPGIAVKFEILQNLSSGSQGNDVKALQELLLKEGVYPNGLITGYFGNLTKQAVIRFQEKYADEILKPAGLVNGTGFVGPSTIKKINRLLGGEVSISMPSGQATKLEILRRLTSGDSGDDVKALQELLLKEGVYPNGLITGYFGNLTKQAVIRFQEKYADEILTPNGLTNGTGLVGPSTRAKMNQLLK